MPSKKDIDFLKDEKIDVYELLGISQDATEASVRKAYRKQALIYHPDKNSDPKAAVRFHQLTVSLSVLTNDKLRKDYDNWVHSNKLQLEKDEAMDEERKRMKDELKKAERNGRSSWSVRDPTKSKVAYDNEVERLREEGLRKRRRLESEHLQKQETVGSKSEKTSQYPLERTVTVRWKAKKGIAELLTTDVLQGILSVFGEVESVKKFGRDPRDRKLEVSIAIFKTETSAKSAVNYNFDEASIIWQDTPYKKLSSLLKSVDWYESNSAQISLVQYKDHTVEKMREFARNHQRIVL